MSTRTTMILALIFIAAATLSGIVLWNRLPDPMASHWGINDQVNGTIPKIWGVYLMPVMSLVLLLLFLIIPNIDPLKANITKFRSVFNLFILFILIFLSYVYGLTLAWNLGFTTFKMSLSLLPAIGLLFVLIGFMLRKAKRNFFIGIRTPWTLSSDRVWNETHRIGSMLFAVYCIRNIDFDRFPLWRNERFFVYLRSDNGFNNIPGDLFICALSAGNKNLANAKTRLRFHMKQEAASMRSFNQIKFFVLASHTFL